MIKSLLKGTIILTLAGLLTRIIGFVYKIYLSNILEAKMLGLYQLVFPVFGICFTIFGAGIQTAVSKLVAARSKDKKYIKKVLVVAIVLSFLLAAILSVLLYFGAGYVAVFMLGESKCTDLLKILAFAFPLCAVAVCINGCYYGLKKAATPALTQLFEQIVRVAFVYIAIILLPLADRYTMCMLAVAGIAVGEGVSMLYSIIMVLWMFRKMEDDASETHTTESGNVLKQLVCFATPLTGNKLIVALLHGVETIIIPTLLKKYGMSSDDALSVYGVLTGMAMPFVMFPSTITNSLAVLLLPVISEANENSDGRLIKMSRMCIAGSLVLGILSIVIFLTIGADIGVYVFHNESIGLFIKILAFLCPFLFVSTTLASIINGLGKTCVTFFITATGLSTRILLTIKTVPESGISGYLISLLVSEVIITIMSMHYYKKYINSK